MKQSIVLVGALLNVSIMAFEWDHVSGMCDPKGSGASTITLAHVGRAQVDLIEQARRLDADIITFDTLSDDQLGDVVYDELKNEYAHFYVGTGASGIVCVASKYSINPSVSISTDDKMDYCADERTSFEMILAMAKDNKSDKDQKPIRSGEWEIDAVVDDNGKLSVEGRAKYEEKNSNGSGEKGVSVTISNDGEKTTSTVEIDYKKTNPESSTQVELGGSVSIDENGNKEGKAKVRLKHTW